MLHRVALYGTLSVQGCIPTQSVGTIRNIKKTLDSKQSIYQFSENKFTIPLWPHVIPGKMRQCTLVLDYARLGKKSGTRLGQAAHLSPFCHCMTDTYN